jgi:hypothetical protein
MDWEAILSRIGPGRPLDLDAALSARDAPWPGDASGMPKNTANVVAGAGAGAAGGAGAGAVPVTPSTRLLHTRGPGRASIGIRLSRPSDDLQTLARHLAAISLEKGIDAIILAPFGPTGFETYGFRVERLPVDPAQRPVAEAELAAFWGMAIIVDAADILRLG